MSTDTGSSHPTSDAKADAQNVKSNDTKSTGPTGAGNNNKTPDTDSSSTTTVPSVLPNPALEWDERILHQILGCRGKAYCRTVAVCKEEHWQPGEKAFGQANHFWPMPSAVTIGLIDPPKGMRERVIAACDAWFIGMGNLSIKLDLLPENKSPHDALVRIKFAATSIDSWSQFGVQALDVKDPKDCTMQIGLADDKTWNDGKSDGKTKLSRLDVTLRHEIGHVLGFSHEHQHPLRNITFNEDVVKADERWDYPGSPWTDDKIKTDVLQLISGKIKGGQFYDPKSIMHYEYPASWIKGATVGTPYNTQVSELDRGSLWGAYPATTRREDNPFRVAVDTAINTQRS